MNTENTGKRFSKRILLKRTLETAQIPTADVESLKRLKPSSENDSLVTDDTQILEDSESSDTSVITTLDRASLSRRPLR